MRGRHVLAAAVAAASLASRDLRGAEPSGALPGPSPRLLALHAEIVAERPGALERFWDEVTAAGTPLVEPAADDPASCLVTFLWRARTPVDAVVVKFSGNSQLTRRRSLDEAALLPLAGTDVWYRTYRLPNDARFTYDLSPDDPLTLLTEIPRSAWAERLARFAPDPLNARRFDGRSFVACAAGQDPATADPPLAPIQKASFHSRILDNDREVQVYVAGPPGVRARNLVVALDGATFAGPMALPATLDRLVARGLAPTMAVMVGNAPGRRIEELHYSERFARALADELLPWIRARYPVDAPRARTIVLGSSLGGNASLFAAFTRSDAFGGAVSLSGGFQSRQHEDDPDFTRDPAADELFEPLFPESEWLTRAIAHAPRRPIRVALGVGLFEDLTEDFAARAPLFATPSLLLATRHLRDVLVARGYPLSYREGAGAHEPLNWRRLLPEALLDVLR